MIAKAWAMVPLVALLPAGLLAADADWIAKAGGLATRDQAGRITRVDLRSSWVTDADLAQLAALPGLEYLDLSLTRITDHGLQQLRNAPAVVELNLYYAELITDEGVAAIKDWKHLKRVNLRGTRITDTTLEHLAGIGTLESIDAGFAQVTDVGPDRLTALPHLRQLTLGGNKLTDVGLQPLRHLQDLTYLDLSGVQRTDSGLWSVNLSDSGVDTIATLRQLRELRIGGMPLSTASIEKLKVLTKLERISLQGCRRLTDDAAAVLALLPALRVADLKGTAFTEKGFDALRAARPETQVLYGPVKVSAAGER
jgi:Leucine-rich repeat (LRR) protein